MSEEIKNSVYEYGELEQRTERRPAAVTPYEQEICQHMEALFPKRETRVYREIDSEFLNVKCSTPTIAYWISITFFILIYISKFSRNDAS